jgi:hypothetical protein
VTDRDGDRQPGPDLVWRVRMLGLDNSTITVEQPSAAGQVIPIQPGVRLVASMSIGQNRWMFHTRAMSSERAGSGRPAMLKLEMPTTVERCQRRNFCRISTAELFLPQVECWPLLDPASAIGAEVANRAQIMERLQNPSFEASVEGGGEPLMLPDVGPKFQGHLMNLGGGGAGLMIDRSDAGALDRSRFFWLRVDLRPHVPFPLAVTGRAVHTHIDSTQNFYVGIAFDWSFNAGHRDFVVEQITSYLESIQSLQSKSAA